MEGLLEGLRGAGRREASPVLQPLGGHGPDFIPPLTQFLHLPVGKVLVLTAWNCFQDVEPGLACAKVLRWGAREGKAGENPWTRVVSSSESR